MNPLRCHPELVEGSRRRTRALRRFRVYPSFATITPSRRLALRSALILHPCRVPRNVRLQPSSLILHPCRAAFTLIEILVVIVIIAILAAITLGGAKYAMTKAATSRAQAEIAAMETALEHYKNDNGVYPPSTTTRASGPPGSPTIFEINNSGSLYTALTTPKTYMTFKPNQLASSGVTTYLIDPFGSPYNYYNPPAPTTSVWSNQTAFDLWSYGPDGKNDTPDDIVNWRR
jgi:prepilin-type N-terminal cleavage/methylation domain-containing protein